MSGLLLQVWRKYRRWPLWGQIGFVLFAVALLGSILGDDPTEGTQVLASESGQVEDNLPRATTSSTVAATIAENATSTTVTVAPTTLPVTTTTTARPTTTTVTAEAPTPACHPSYEGACLPVAASDVDCAGGSGNGPAYALEQDFIVVGPDVYDLDGDNDGVACESSDGVSSTPRTSVTQVPTTVSSGSTSYANCAAARAAGAAPVHRGEPGYGPHLDRDGDGVGCE